MGGPGGAAGRTAAGVTEYQRRSHAAAAAAAERRDGVRAMAEMKENLHVLGGQGVPHQLLL